MADLYRRLFTQISGLCSWIMEGCQGFAAVILPLIWVWLPGRRVGSKVRTGESKGLRRSLGPDAVPPSSTGSSNIVPLLSQANTKPRVRAVDAACVSRRTQNWRWLRAPWERGSRWFRSLFIEPLSGVWLEKSVLAIEHFLRYNEGSAKRQQSRFTRVAIESLESRLAPVVSLSIVPLAGSTLPVSINVNQLSDVGRSGFSRADLAIDYDPAKFTVSSTDMQIPTGGVVPQSNLNALSGWAFNVTINQAMGQLAIHLTSPAGTPIVATDGGILVLTRQQRESRSAGIWQ